MRAYVVPRKPRYFRYPSRAHYFGYLGQPVPEPGTANPQKILATIVPGSRPITSHDDLKSARRRIIFSSPLSLSEIAILGSTGRRPNKGYDETIVMFTYGPRAGRAEIIPSSELLGKRWYIVDPSKEVEAYPLGIVQKLPTEVPIDFESFLESIEIIQGYLDSARRHYKIEDYSPALVSIQQGRWNLEMASFKLNAIRDFGIIDKDGISAYTELIKNMSDGLTKVESAIMARSTLVGRVVQWVIDLFQSAQDKIAGIISKDYSKRISFLYKVYKLRDVTEALLREMAHLPQTGPVVNMAKMISLDLKFLNSQIDIIERTAQEHGIRIDELFKSRLNGFGQVQVRTALPVAVSVWPIITKIAALLRIAVPMLRTLIRYIAPKIEKLATAALFWYVFAKVPSKEGEKAIKAQYDAQTRELFVQFFMNELNKMEDQYRGLPEADRRKEAVRRAKEYMKMMPGFSKEDFKALEESIIPLYEEASKRVAEARKLPGEAPSAPQEKKEEPLAPPEEVHEIHPAIIVALLAGMIGIPLVIWLKKK